MAAVDAFIAVGNVEEFILVSVLLLFKNGFYSNIQLELE